MGKYSWYLTKYDDRDMEIAVINEAAEHNRLLRLQIKLNYGMITTKKEIKAELEDQA
jgi:hypothetical protein